MDDKLIHKLMNIVKDKFTKTKQTYHDSYDYAFSVEEIENINKQNKQKIQELKQDIFTKNKINNDKPSTEEVLSKVEPNIEVENEVTEAINNPEDNLEIPQEELIEEPIISVFIGITLSLTFLNKL
jgi:hypothetical protein